MASKNLNGGVCGFTPLRSGRCHYPMAPSPMEPNSRETGMMKRVWFAALAALGFALATGAMVPVVNAETTSLHPPNQSEGSNN